MVGKYSKQLEGEIKLTENFKVKEFACKDGSDEILIDCDIVLLAQKVRNLIGCALNINSAYRSIAYNRKVGAKDTSQHTKGKAIDVRSKYGALILARAFELLGAGGVGYYPYSPFCHADSRTGKSRWLQSTKNCSSKSVSTFLTKDKITQVQRILNSTFDNTSNMRYYCGKVDGIAGEKTKSAFSFFCDNAPAQFKKEMIAELKKEG